jgi:hypothetical protein
MDREHITLEEAERLEAAPSAVHSASDAMAAMAASIVARPFVWRDPKTIRVRQWLYGQHLIREFGSADIAPPGVGKSTMQVAMALAIATGRDLLGEEVHESVPVWLLNLEDPLEETERRVTAAMLAFNVRPEDVEGRLFVGGRETKIVTAIQTKEGTKIQRPVVEAIEAQIRARGIGVVIVDPFVSSHRVAENDNSAIDDVAKEWAAIAGRCNCAINLVHHTRKRQIGQSDLTVDDARGGSALIGAVRAARVLNRMSEEEAARYGVETRKQYFRADDGKANLAPESDKARWFQIVGQCLDNHPTKPDWVGVVRSWEPPNLTQGVTLEDLAKVRAIVGDGTAKAWRESQQSPDWVGHAIGEALGWSASKPSESARIKASLRMWLLSGALVKSTITDRYGKDRPAIICGELAS